MGGFHGVLDFSPLNNTKKAGINEIIEENSSKILKDGSLEDTLLPVSCLKSSISHSSLIVNKIEKDIRLCVDQFSKFNVKKTICDHNFVEIKNNKKYIVTPDVSQTKKKKENTLAKKFNSSPLFISSPGITPIHCKMMLKSKVYPSFDDVETMSKMSNKSNKSNKSLFIDNTMKNNSFDTKAFVNAVSPEQPESI